MRPRSVGLLLLALPFAALQLHGALLGHPLYLRRYRPPILDALGGTGFARTYVVDHRLAVGDAAPAGYPLGELPAGLPGSLAMAIGAQETPATRSTSPSRRPCPRGWCSSTPTIRDGRRRSTVRPPR